MKLLIYVKRCSKEIIRDPLNIMFGLGFPIVLLLLLSAIQANIPVELFQIESLTPGISVFGLSFMSLFAGTLIAKDRESSFLQRLYTTPLKSKDFILGYMIPLIPMSLLQGVICYIVAIIIGLPITINILYAVLFLIPSSILFISIGLLCGSLFNVKQVGGICGALLTNLSAWFSGIWFDIDLIGGFFGKIANWLPFIHAVELERLVLSGNFIEIWNHLGVVLIYDLVIILSAVLFFLKQMKKN